MRVYKCIHTETKSDDLRKSSTPSPPSTVTRKHTIQIQSSETSTVSILRTGDRHNIFQYIVFLPFGHSFARKLRYFYDDAKEKSIADSLYSTVHRFQMNPFSDKHSETRFCRVDINVKGKKKIREKKKLEKTSKIFFFFTRSY